MFGRPDINVIHTMNRLQIHRGPDGQDAWADEHLALGHTRLAIVDRAGGDQPIFGPEGEVLIANGEIYNHTSLCLLYTSPSPRDLSTSRMPSSA